MRRLRKSGARVLSDLVVDTNVWVHAQNPQEARFQDSLNFLSALQSSEVLICLDRNFDPTGASNTSLIGTEYLQSIPPTGFSYSVLAYLLASSRVKSIDDAVGQAERKAIERIVPRNKKDRRFLRVAYNSDERHLVSHDFQDFDSKARSMAQRDLNVTIVEAFEVILIINLPPA